MSRMLRAVRHLRQDATKYSFSLEVQALQIYREEPAEVFIELCRGTRRVRDSAPIQLGEGENLLTLKVLLEFYATLFRPKRAASGTTLLKRGKQRTEPGGAATDAAPADEFLQKEAKIQLVADREKAARRSPLRLISRSRPSPSVSSASVLLRDPSAAASAALSVSPENRGEGGRDTGVLEKGLVVAEASLDLAALVAAEAEGRHSLKLLLANAKGSLLISFTCTKLDGLGAEEDDGVSVYSAALSPPGSFGGAGVLNAKGGSSPNQTEATPEPLVLRLPNRETLPSLLEVPPSEESTPQQQQEEQPTTTTAQANGAPAAPAALKLQRPPELLSTGTATTPAELSPSESQRHQQRQHQLQQQHYQQQEELRRKDQLIASLQRQVALMEEEDRQAPAPQLAQLFQQIDDLHTALAAAQEQQLAAAEQLQQQQQKGDFAAEVATLQQQLQAAEFRIQQQDQHNRELQQQHQELKQKNNEQQQQLLLLQAERDGIQLIADAYKKQLEEQQKQRHQQKQQQPQQLQEERVVLLLQQQEEERHLLEKQLVEETREREAATSELRLLQHQLQQQQLLQQTDDCNDTTAALRGQLMALQRQLAEALETREALRHSKAEEISRLNSQLQALQQKYGETQAQQQQTLHKLSTATEETEALREKIRCQEETLQRLPTQAAWSCAQQQHQLLLQQQREWQQQQRQQQRHQELEVADKTKRIEELEKELVFAKVELAAAEQRRHEDIDAFKKKLEGVKASVLAYAAASSSSNLQKEPSFRGNRDSSSSGKGSPVKRLVPIGTLKALFRHSHPTTTTTSNPAAAPVPASGRSLASSNSSTTLVHAPRITGNASELRNIASNSSNNSCNSSGTKARPATVSLFGNQRGRDSPPGPSVTRFRTSAGGGCSLLTTSGP